MRRHIVPDFAIRPPVHLRNGQQIGSTSDAASIVKRHAMSHCSLVAATLLHRIEGIETGDEAASISLEFRSWAAREGLLLTKPRAA